MGSQNEEEVFGSFDDILKEIRLLHKKKYADYGPLPLIHSGFTGSMIRIGDKVARIENYMKTGKLKVNESIEDTLKDIIVYSVLALELYRQKVGVYKLVPLEKFEIGKTDVEQQIRENKALKELEKEESK